MKSKMLSIALVTAFLFAVSNFLVLSKAEAEPYLYKPNDAFKNSPYILNGYYSPYLKTSDGRYLVIGGVDSEGNPLYYDVDTGDYIYPNQLDSLNPHVVSKDQVDKYQNDQLEKLKKEKEREILTPALILLAIALFLWFFGHFFL